MAEVAELDRLKKAIVKKYVKKNENHDTLKKYIKEDVFKQLKDQIDEFSYLVDNEADLSKMDISTLVDNFIYDSFKKSRTVFKLKRLDKNCKEIPFVHDDYYKDIIKKRNVFAHEEEVVKDGMVSLTYEDGTPLEFTQEHCIQIRKDIKKYKSILEQISAKLDN